MPEKYAGQDPKHWETGLSFLLLAQREISQASMRFNKLKSLGCIAQKLSETTKEEQKRHYDKGLKTKQCRRPSIVVAY